MLVSAGGAPIDVAGFAAPFVGDLNEDGKNDLLVGQRVLGTLRVYLNRGTNAQPRFDRFEWFRAGGRIASVPPCCQVGFTPQLVDFDGDGRTDVVTGAGAGEVYVFRRNEDGTFAEAEVLANKRGELQMGRYFPENRTSRVNSTVFVHDWDRDGDGDLLIRFCLVPNEGPLGRPVFGDAMALEVEGQPITRGIAKACIADWDGDGRDDLLAGRGREVVWYRNTVDKGWPKLQAPEILVAPGESKPDLENEPARYHAMCVADLNSDGRLDLLLGDSFSKKRDVELTEEQKAEIGKTAAVGRAASSGYYSLARELAEGATQQERIDRMREALRKWQKYVALAVDADFPTSSNYHYHGRVWLYERLAAKHEQSN
jgi:hypothetical protein